METLDFERRLRLENYAANTIIAYKYAVLDYHNRFKTLSKENLQRYKTSLMDRFKPQTVNLRILAINKYLAFVGRPELRIKCLKLPRHTFVDNVISNDDYLFFKNMLRRKESIRWYYIVWSLAATGARISELVQFKVEHVFSGYIDVFSKGGRMRRLYFPVKLRKDVLQWLEKENRYSGYLFLNARGERLTPRGIALRLKHYAAIYGIDPVLVHPHAFRHLFAKNFLRKSNDITLLADLMGHNSIETTRIYLQQSSREQGKLMDRIVDW